MDTDFVRQIIIDSLLRFGADSTEPSWETLMIADGRRLGRQFEYHEIRAIWFWERNSVEFFDKNATLLGEIKLQKPERVPSYCPAGVADTDSYNSEGF